MRYLLLLVVSLIVSCSSQRETESLYNNITLPEESDGYESMMSHYKDDLYFTVGFDHNIDQSEDYGLRFYMLRKDDDGLSTLFESKGSKDRYLLKPTFYSNDKVDPLLIILAETGAEYSHGIRVFLVSKADTVKDVGTLNVGVWENINESIEGTPRGNISSAIPYTTIKYSQGKLIFTFSEDVFFDPGGSKQKEISKNAISYVYSNNMLEAVFD
jgi:hypothetical protein